MKTRSLLSGLVVAASLASSAFGSAITLLPNQVHIPSKLGNIKVMHDENGFFIKKNEKHVSVQNCDVDKKLRNLSNKQLKKMLGGSSDKFVWLSKEQLSKLGIDFKNAQVATEDEAKAIKKAIKKSVASQYIVVTKFDTGEYKLALSPRLLGGGAGGAWLGAWMGKIAVHVAAQTAILVVSIPVSIVATPAVGAAVHAGISNAVMPAVEITSIAVACAGGIAGGVATGPV